MSCTRPFETNLFAVKTILSSGMSFGIGTIPALFIVAKLADMGWLKKREIIYRIGTVFMIFIGLYFVVQGIRI